MPGALYVKSFNTLTAGFQEQWEPEKRGLPFIAQKGNPWALGCDDVPATRAELEAKGVQFLGETLDTGVCHMAFFSDPDGNDLMLHHRYAPYD
jgi:predicted enzyme related to lactoylglutathione lyase